MTVRRNKDDKDRLCQCGHPKTQHGNGARSHVKPCLHWHEELDRYCRCLRYKPKSG